jgi:hypothetical protein
MSFKTRIAFLLILVCGRQISSSGQTITFHILKKMVASREYKDSIVNSFKFIKGIHIPSALYGVESESYMSPDSSQIIELIYKDSASGCVLYTKDMNLLQKIVSAGQNDGFARTSGLTPNPSPHLTTYIKGKYLLSFVNNGKDKRKSYVSLAKNYHTFIDVTPK